MSNSGRGWNCIGGAIVRQSRIQKCPGPGSGWRQYMESLTGPVSTNQPGANTTDTLILDWPLEIIPQAQGGLVLQCTHLLAHNIRLDFWPIDNVY